LIIDRPTDVTDLMSHFTSKVEKWETENDESAIKGETKRFLKTRKENVGLI